MSFCIKCGKQNDDTAKFCTGCGSNLLTLVQKKSAYYSVGKSKWIVSGVLTVVLLVAGIYFLFIHKSKPNVLSTSNIADTATISGLAVQPFIDKSSYNLPPEVNYSTNLKTEFNIDYYGPFFYPVGFSRDGKFAWVEGENPGESNDFSFMINIQSLETDKVLWQWSTDAEYGANETDLDGFNQKSFRNIWVNQNKFLTRQLNEYQIEPYNFKRLEKFPLNLNGRTINLSLQNKFYFDNGTPSEIASTQIFVIVDGVEKKLIFNKKYEKTNTGEFDAVVDILVNRYILGYLINPLENRIAILLFDDYVGWEAGHYPRIQIVGCDLNSVY